LSVKPSKQRKFLITSPLHIKHKLLSAPLSPELREKYGKKSFPVRKGDSVRVMRGDYVGVEGKVTQTDPKTTRIFIEGVTREKADGSTYFVPISPSKVEITKINIEDKWRSKKLKEKPVTEALKEEPKKEENV
jgi:large subunit ribosomal protein L24